LLALAITQGLPSYLLSGEFVSAKYQGELRPTGIGFFELRLHAAQALAYTRMHLHRYTLASQSVQGFEH
jgi:hypothetical protein